MPSDYLSLAFGGLHGGTSNFDGLLGSYRFDTALDGQFTDPLLGGWD